MVHVWISFLLLFNMIFMYVDQSSADNCLPLQIYMSNVNMLNLRQNPRCNESEERMTLAFRERERDRGEKYTWEIYRKIPQVTEAIFWEKITSS